MIKMIMNAGRSRQLPGWPPLRVPTCVASVAAAHSGNDNVHDVVADDVMQRVAGDMGLISSAELLILKDRAGVQSS